MIIKSYLPFEMHIYKSFTKGYIIPKMEKRIYLFFLHEPKGKFAALKAEDIGQRLFTSAIIIQLSMDIRK